MMEPDAILKKLNEFTVCFSGGLNFQKYFEFYNEAMSSISKPLVEDQLSDNKPENKIVVNDNYIIQCQRLGGLLSRTKLVLVSPHYIFLNKTGIHIEI